MRNSALLIALLFLAGCNDDPARSVKIAPRPSQPAPSVRPEPTPPTLAAPQLPQPKATRAAAAKPPATSANLFPEYCPIPAEESPGGPSSLVAKGACEFEHHSTASCEPIGDDFLVGLTRPAKGGGSLVAFLNVEQYKGPGNYENAQLFVAVQSGKTIHRWSSETVSAVVGAGEAFVALPSTRLDLEPTLVDCSTLISPSSNYLYQCAGRGEVLKAAPEVVSGKLQCAGK